jgi:replication factor C subunit 3/5
MLEACHVQRRDGLVANMPVQTTDWELYIKQLAVEITREQSPQRLMAAREKLYELLVNCIPATVILKTLSKDIFHLEAFVAKYMAIYKKYLNDMFG